MIVATSKNKNFSIPAILIQFYQKTTFSHILIIDKNLVFQASNGFVNCMHIDNFLSNNIIVDQYEIPDDSIDMEFVYSQLGKKYNFIQILQIVIKYLTGIRITFNSKNDRFICSEFVGKSLRLQWVNDFTTPIDIVKYLKTLKNE